MSKARLVITSIEIEGRSVADVVASYGVSRSWVYELLARYRAEGQAAFEPRSRRPKTSPTAISERTVELIIELRKKLTEFGLAPRAPSQHQDLYRHCLADSDSPRHGRAEPEEAPQVLLHPLRRRAAQRDLAIGLHPLPTHQT